MPYLAKTTIIGHIGKDAELKLLADSKKMITFPVAVNCGYGDKKITNWFDVSTFRTLPDWKFNSLVKGATVLVIGDFKFTVSEKNGKNYSHLNINAETIEILPKKEKEEAATASEPVQGAFDYDIPPF